MSLSIPRVKPLGWVDDELLVAAQLTQMDLNISLLDGQDGVDQLLAYHAGMRFTRTDLGVGSSSLNFLTAVQQTTAIGSPANRQQMILATGIATGIQFSCMLDGTSPGHLVIAGGGATPICAPASDASGTIFWGASSALVKSSADTGTTISAVAVTGQTHNVLWTGCTTSHYLAMEDTSFKLYHATSLGGTWSSQTIPGFVTGMATNGTGTWVLFCWNTSSSTILYSTDDGVTFTSAQVTGGLGSTVSGAWSPALQKFVALETLSGALWTSPDGITWTLRKTVAALVGIPFLAQSVAVCGSAIACIVNRGVNSLGKYPFGIAYTLDAGVSWNESYIASPFGTNPLTSLISANGRFYALDGVALYQSDILTAPPILYSGV
jgi:hypothetical protein